MLFRIFLHLLCFSILSTVVCARAQQSLFQSASGDSAIYLPNTTGVLSYNLGSDQARFDFNYDFFDPKTKSGNWSLGGGVGGTIKKGSGTIVNKNAPANGAFGEAGMAWRFALPDNGRIDKLDACVEHSGDANGGKLLMPGGSYAKLCHEKNGQFLLGQFHYGRSSFYNLASGSNPVSSPASTSFNQYRGTVALNILRTTHNADFRIGAAYVLGSDNNLSDLKQETYQSQVITTSASSQSVLSTSLQDVYVGAYATHISQQLNVDAVLQPRLFDYQIAVDALLRSDFGGGPGVRYGSPGVGVFFFIKGKPVVPVGGLTYTYRAGNNQLAISAGWSFGGAAAQ